MRVTCPQCDQRVEVHSMGWLHDHTVDGRLDGDLCPGSGTDFDVPARPVTDEDFAALPILDLEEFDRYRDEDAERGDR